MQKVKNVYGWSEKHQRQLEKIHARLSAKGLPVTRNGQPNASAIILYLIERESLKK